MLYAPVEVEGADREAVEQIAQEVRGVASLNLHRNDRLDRAGLLIRKLIAAGAFSGVRYYDFRENAAWLDDDRRFGRYRRVFAECTYWLGYPHGAEHDAYNLNAIADAALSSVGVVPVEDSNELFPDDTILSRQEIANALNVTDSAVRNWSKDNKWPIHEQGSGPNPNRYRWGDIKKLMPGRHATCQLPVK